MRTLAVSNRARVDLPRVPFARLAKDVLPGYDVSLVFVTKREARTLNRRLRGKEYVPNVLSYEAGTKSVELILCPALAQEEASAYGLTYRAYLALLFIHGLLHLKGYRHGDTMERRERELLARIVSVPLPSHGTTHSNRHRPRVASNENRRRRRGAR